MYDFDERWLMINNIEDDYSIDMFRGLADRLYITEHHAGEVLDFFELKKEDFKGGYWYSIAELTELYYAKDFDYLVHFSSDAKMDPPADWVTPAIDILEHYDHIAVVSPYSEVNTWGDVDQFFSDQAYVVRVKEFRDQIYGQPGIITDYPAHGGNSFEHMCAKYMRANNRYRQILKDFYYAHPAI